ncbi:sorting assembly machinery 50 kDa subunit [Diutina catenulata]
MSLDHDDDLLNKLGSSSNYGSAPLSEYEKQVAQLEQEKAALALRQRNEYLSDVFQANATVPVRVRNVQVTNGQAFRSSFLNAQFAPLLSGKPVTIKHLMTQLDTITNQFKKLGMVEQCMVQLHQLQDRKLTVVPVFNMVPVKRFYAKTGTNIGNGEGDGYIQFQLRNVFGGGENVGFDAVTGTKTNSSYLLNYNMPVNNNGDYVFDVSGYSNSRQHDWFGANVFNRGLTTKIFTQYDPKVTRVNHEVSVENCWRIIDNLYSKAQDVFYHSGSHFKSSILYNLTYDTRDNTHLPFSGRFCRLGLEYNGLSSLVRYPYTKVVGEYQLTGKVGNHQIIVSNKAGLLFPHSKSGASLIADRFFIGGPNDVRGFLLNGLGPKQNKSSVGGNAFLNGGISVVSPLPFLKNALESGFRIHTFFNYGKLVAETDVRQLLMSDYSTSVGVGILFNHPMARFELNVVLPVTAHDHDSMRKGLQWGIGMSFL